MLSEEQRKSKSTTPGDRVSGSLQSMNLGALLVGQLSQAINWSNDTSFKRPECRPWVDLPTVSGDLKNEGVNSAVTPGTGVLEPAAVDDSASKVAHDASVEADSATQLDPSSADIVQVVSERIETSESAPPTSDPSKEVATEEIKAAVPVELASTTTEVEEDKVAVDVAKAEFETAARPDQSTTNPVKTFDSPRKLEEEKEDETPIASTSFKESLPESPTVSNANRSASSIADNNSKANAKEVESIAKPISVVTTPRQDSSRSKPAAQATNDEVVEKFAKPHPRPSYQGAERVPLAIPVSKSPRVEIPQDDYLLQLERLVVELNMELARVRGEEATIDPIEQMANRIIALNLENLALREQLQQSSQKS